MDSPPSSLWQLQPSAETETRVQPPEDTHDIGADAARADMQQTTSEGCGIFRFYGLPTELQRLILADYCQATDVVTLDSAFCSHKLRPQWLAVLSGRMQTWHALHHDHFTAPNMLALHWVVKRQIQIPYKLQHLNVSPSISLSAEFKNLAINSSTGTSTTAMQLQTQAAVKLLVTCSGDLNTLERRDSTIVSTYIYIYICVCVCVCVHVCLSLAPLHPPNPPSQYTTDTQAPTSQLTARHHKSRE